MTDSINKYNEKEVSERLVKFSVNYINNKYNLFSSDWKGWALVVIHKLNKNTENDIQKVIDEFFEYYKENYQKYCDDLVICSDDFIKDWGFVESYIKKKSVE